MNCGAPLTLRDRFSIIRPLGEGGLGKTYLAQDRDKFNEPCVVKQLKYQPQGTATDQKVIELFCREAQQLMNLRDHPLIPELYAYFEEKGGLYLVQEWIEGQDLQQELQAGCFSEDKIWDLLQSILPILAFIHERGVIHRDLKPANLMRRRLDGRLMLIDFGVSRQLSQGVTQIQTGTIVGTPGYAPYEQMIQDPEKPGPSSDLYSLGVTCFELITGVAPYPLTLEVGYHWVDHWQQYLKQPLSPHLTGIMDKLLKIKSSDRFQSAAEVLRALQPEGCDGEGAPSPLGGKPRERPLSQTLQAPVCPSNAVGKGRLFLRSPLQWLGLVLGVIGVGGLGFWGWQELKPSLRPWLGENLPTQGDPLRSPPDPSGEAAAAAEVWFQRATEKYNQGDYPGAIADYTRAIQLDPTFSEAYYRRGNAHAYLDEKTEAIDDYTRALAGDPGNAEVHHSRGRAYADLGEYPQAIEDYDQAIERQPEYGEAYNSRGIARFTLDDKQGAIADYTQAINLNPRNFEALQNRGFAHYALDQQKKAIADFSRAINLESNSAEAYYGRGLAQADLDNPQAAMDDYNQALKLNPDFGEAYYHRGIVHLALGNPRSAIQDLSAALRINPDADAYYHRGLAHSDAGEAAAAIDDYTKAIQQVPDYVEAYNNRGNAWAAMGKHQQALEDYSEAIRLNSAFAEAYQGRGQTQEALGNSARAIKDYEFAASLYQEQGRNDQYAEVRSRIRALSP